MASPSELQDLERRAEREATAEVFNQLADEYRRAGRIEDAARVAHAGVLRQPGFIFAQITLIRALLELGQIETAKRALDAVSAALVAFPEAFSGTRGVVDSGARSRATLEPTVEGGPAPGAAPLMEVRRPTRDEMALSSLSSLLRAVLADRDARHGQGL